MAGLLERFGLLKRAGRGGSAASAKERLHFVLLHDRIDLSPEELDRMKKEILEVISRYVAVESDRVDFALEHRRRDNLIVAEVPFSKPKTGTQQVGRETG
ncbi:MAG: cell division topological specificity factor MinE [Anaerolineae bacterium]|nr:cell division topological specificity factor MinE [Anaerolineae bacterium]